MKRKDKRPDIDTVLNSLKDFQRNTVEYVFNQLYINHGSRRFLVADEVGLGKTLVARGVIARAIDYLWDKVDRIDIIYICSNADIAKQNVNRLGIPGLNHFPLASRITLLPITLKKLKKQQVNFVSFTPGTSFNLGLTLGRADERALLYWLLRETWDLQGTGPLNVLRGYKDKDRFRSEVRYFRDNHDIDPDMAHDFAETLNRRIEAEKKKGGKDIRQRFDDLCYRFRRVRIHIPEEDRILRQQMVGELRELLAVTCITALEPDLIILDEFQRFKYLLNGQDQASGLARGLFEYENARTLLLSATPYKMYTLSDELDQDNHYEDFLNTVDFLYNDDDETAQFKQLLSSYRRELYRLGDATKRDKTQLLLTKQALETKLRRVIVRTEKLAASADRNGMLKEVTTANAYLQAPDLESYVNLQQIANHLGQHNTLEYWKSAPYLLNFMENYKLKQTFTNALTVSERDAELARLLTDAEHLLLSREDIVKYEAIDPGNARLRHLLADTVDIGTWRLLWLPPALPYYELGHPFAEAKFQQFTKRLVFSAWHVVPKMVASLVSYDAERSMVCSYEAQPENTPEARKKRRGLLRFAREEDRLTGMPVLGLLYPCLTLAKECDPFHYCVERNSSELPTIDELVTHTQQRIEELLTHLKQPQTGQGVADEAWYWAAPILLDLHFAPKKMQEWWQMENLASRWTGDDDATDEQNDMSAWAAHIARVQDLLAGEIPTGRPPEDLALVLAQMAIAGPGVTSMRALSRITGGPDMLVNPTLRLGAASIAWAFRSLFNIPEVMALLRGMNNQEPYWRRVLEYCLAGGLQAVLDEYAHVLRESQGLLSETADRVAIDVAEVMRDAIQLRPASLKIDDYRIPPDASDIQLGEYRLRTHFALRFGDDKSDDDKRVDRKKLVRQAFNSPFWPFVLVTTSVGQEGLDFHLYCHAIMHWNLPANPVDLEQREGRVHRYKGHAVRKNLAYKKGGEVLFQKSIDPWQELFELGRCSDTTELVPFWIYPERGEAIAYIERHVPTLPLSRDIQRLSALRKSLAVYRMVFGQNRQDDLVAYLLAYLSEEEIMDLTNQLQINLEPPVRH